ncbi:MAG: hypothetical protein ABF391_05500 [Akkermansiaceae bacterium]
MKRIKRIDLAEIRKPHSKWTGNDASGNYQTGLLNPSDTRDFTLYWKKDATEEPLLVGYFRFRIEMLIESGHCYRHGDKVRINIFHDRDKWLRVRSSRGGNDGVQLAKLPW